MPFRVEGNKIYGPGTYDMKGAIVCLLTAVKALRELGEERRNARSSVCSTPMEEINSTTSRPVIDKLARESHCVLILGGWSRRGCIDFTERDHVFQSDGQRQIQPCRNGSSRRESTRLKKWRTK